MLPSAMVMTDKQQVMPASMLASMPTSQSIVNPTAAQVHDALAAHPALQRLPYVYLNYRVFSRTATGDELQLVRR
jgi:hypothetical protein